MEIKSWMAGTRIFSICMSRYRETRAFSYRSRWRGAIVGKRSQNDFRFWYPSFSLYKTSPISFSPSLTTHRIVAAHKHWDDRRPSHFHRPSRSFPDIAMEWGLKLVVAMPPCFRTPWSDTLRLPILITLYVYHVHLPVAIYLYDMFDKDEIAKEANLVYVYVYTYIVECFAVGACPGRGIAAV